MFDSGFVRWKTEKTTAGGISLFIIILKEKEDGGETALRNLPAPYVNNVAPPPLERHWTNLPGEAFRLALSGVARARSVSWL